MKTQTPFHRVLLILTLSLLMGSAAAEPVADPPSEARAQDPFPPLPGFSWVRLDDLHASVMVPDGWRHHTKNAPGVLVIHAFSGESLDTNGMFSTGFSAFSYVPPKGLADPPLYTRRLMHYLARSIETKSDINAILHKTGYAKQGFEILALRHRNAPSDKTPIVVHSIYVGELATGEVRQFMFESPESTWVDAWKQGQTILRSLALDVPKPISPR